MLRFRIVTACLGVALALTSSAPLRAQNLEVAGYGSAPLPHKKDAKLRKSAFDAAESAALADALSHAAAQIRERDSNPADTANHWPEYVVNKYVVSQEEQNGIAVVNLKVVVDPERLRRYLDRIHDDSAVQSLETNNMVVLAYTVEGMDPNRSESPKLHEVIVSRERLLDHRNKGEKVLYDNDSADSRHTAAGGYQAYDSAGRSEVARASGLDDFLTGLHTGSALARSDQNQASGVSAGAQVQDSDSANSTTYRKDFHDNALTVASRDYVRVTDYADNTKKTGALTNEVRVQLEGMFQKAGLALRNYPMRLAGLEFGSDEDLEDVVLTQVAQDPAVDDNDFIAIAVNRLTPVDASHRFTASVTYRVIRKGDGRLILPSTHVLGDSGAQVSDDFGQGIATQVALSRAASQLSGQIEDAVRQASRASARAAAAGTYTIQLVNINDAEAAATLEQAMRNAGYQATSIYRQASRSANITVQLNGRGVAQVRSLVSRNVGQFDIVSLDDRKAVLSGR
jgi:hypothetical protein